MFNETVNLAGDAAAVYTENVYNAYNLTSCYATIVGAFFILLMITSIVLYPKLVARIIVGYVGLIGVVMGWLIVGGFVNSLGPITTALSSFLHELGVLILDYIVPFLASLPVAYYVGYKIEQIEKK